MKAPIVEIVFSVVNPSDVLGHVERSLLTGLLIAQQHNYTDELSRTQPPTRPRTVRRVVDLIQAHPDRQYTLGELARVAGTPGPSRPSGRPNPCRCRGR
ncbi:hypothetical protein AB0L88_08185 [Saccharopolyspora shandongensis]|uniref:hypothetical protein n=1 Tax=Saccharopolyspora shandongensis TaxID=418495 RepID=UPI00343EB65F